MTPLPGFSTARLKMAVHSYRPTEIGSEFWLMVHSLKWSLKPVLQYERNWKCVWKWYINRLVTGKGVVVLQFIWVGLWRPRVKGHWSIGGGGPSEGFIFVVTIPARWLFVLEELPTHFGAFWTRKPDRSCSFQVQMIWMKPRYWFTKWWRTSTISRIR